MRKADWIYWLLMASGVLFVLAICLLTGASMLGIDSLHWDSLRSALERHGVMGALIHLQLWQDLGTPPTTSWRA